MTDDDADSRLRQLMRAAQEGDRASYDHLLRQIAPIIRAVVRRQRNFLATEDVEDLVQEALLSVHAVRATYDPDRPFMPWLMAIVRNRVADAGRRYALSRAVEQAAVDFYETFRPMETNINEEGYGDPERLQHAIGKLPDGQRRAIELLKLRGLSLKEASRETGMSVVALKVAVHRATKTLRTALKRHT
ncbi:MAG: sigma-70 family RNA polymerase sigma factor [Gammaproteobacteria bacterium]